MADEGKQTEEEMSVPLVWVGIEDEIPLASNQIISQYDGDMFIISFGFASPPIFIGSKKEMMEQAKRLRSVSVRPTARIAMTPDQMDGMIKVLQGNLRAYRKKKAEHEK